MVVTLWLQATGRLILFVHPRYIWFTVAFAIIALVLLSIQAIWGKTTETKRTWVNLMSIGLASVILVSMTIVTPTALSSQLASQKQVNTGSALANNESLDVEDYHNYTIKDWANLLASKQPFEFADKNVTMTGFIVPIDDNTFYLSRFVVYCCAVDAQPVGVPISEPNWESKYSEGDWLEIQGKFDTSQNTASYRATFIPQQTLQVEQPKIPYVY